tara:strand:- start:2449 stop:3228 length:780 start_codon:yes stop_codon:yes gene_type:complete
MQKVTINKILKKKNRTSIVCLTSYSKAITQIADKYCDIILVGDSLGMVLYGMKTTREVKLETMILHAKTVKKFAKKSLVVFDMPFRTYTNKLVAYKNAKKVMNLTKCDAIKLEGGKKITNIIKYLTKRKIPVMGHIGLLPQISTNYKVKGKSFSQKEKILNDAISVSNSGVFALIIECVVENLAKEITKKVTVPTIGIGASKYCDGQILVIDDMLGLSDFYPKFVNKYSDLKKVIEKSIRSYTRDVKLKKFPYKKNVYK